MSALIPAIIQFIMSRRRGGGGGGGGGASSGGGGERDMNEIARKYMLQQMLYDMDNVDKAADANTPNLPRSGGGSRIPNIQLSPVQPGVFSPKK